MEDGEMQSSSGKLAVVLLKTFGAIGMGYICVKYKWIDPSKGEMKSIGFYVGKVAFPLLVFRTVATANVGNVAWGVIIGCNVAKFLAWMTAFALAYLFMPGNKLINATLFGYFVIASNDFAVGFPVIDALYPVEPGQPNMATFLAINALAVTVFFNPLTLILFSLGQDSGSSGGGGFSVIGLLSNIFLNPVMGATVAGFVFQLGYPGDLTEGFPSPMSDLIALATSPFGMLALFLTGSSLKSMTMAIWPTVFVLLKVIFCAYLGAVIVEILLPDNQFKDQLLNFSYLYGSIPTSSAPLVFAGEYAPENQELVATSIIFGLLVSGPTMFMSSILFEQEDDGDVAGQLAEIMAVVTYVSAVCAIAVFAIFFIGRQWFTAPPVDIVVAYGFAVSFYLGVKAYLVETSCNHGAVLQNFNQSGMEFVILPSSFAILYGFAQNLCRSLIMLLMYWKILGFPVARTKMAVVGVMVVSFLISLVTPPNTINEMCDLHPSHWSVMRTTGVVILWFVFGAVVFLMSLRANTVDSGETDEGIRTETVIHGFLLAGLSPPRHAVRLPSTAITLGISLALRLFMEALLGSIFIIRPHAAESASFKQMLIIEHILEHMQAPVLLGIMVLNDEFAPICRRILHADEPEATQSITDVQKHYDAIKGQISAKMVPRKWMWKTYDDAVSGEDIVEALILMDRAETRREAHTIGMDLACHGFIVQVDGQHVFFDTPSVWYYLDHQSAHAVVVKENQRTKTGFVQSPGMEERVSVLNMQDDGAGVEGVVGGPMEPLVEMSIVRPSTSGRASGRD